MIVQESDALLQALDRRLQIDRVVALDPVTPVSARDAGGGASRPAAAGAAEAAQQTTLAARLPLGRVVPARIVAIPDAGHVVADIERWRVSMAWPNGAVALLRPGQDILLRVLAHQPMLLFQNVDAAGDPLDADGRAANDAPIRWSAGALQLSGQGVASTSHGGDGAIRFTEPIIDVKIVSLEPGDGADRKPSDATMQAAPTMDRIALDDVIVARSASPTDPTIDSRNNTDTHPAEASMTASAASMAPIVLQGPAWSGQAMELVVRRERADDELDNPVLDHWCGEIVIELPRLGRVSGHLALSMQGLRIRLEGEDAATVASMGEATASLAAALADADLRVQTLSVGQPGAGRASGGSPTASGDAHG